MKIKLEPYKKPTITNQWVMSVQFMHGDADGYTTREYIAETEEGFIAMYTFFNNFLKIRREEQCDLSNNILCESKQDIIAILDNKIKWTQRSYPNANNSYYEKAKQVVEEFFGEFNSIDEIHNDIYRKYGVDVELDMDHTCEGYYAMIDEIEYVFYYDENGTQFNVTVEE